MTQQRLSNKRVVGRACTAHPASCPRQVCLSAPCKPLRPTPADLKHTKTGVVIKSVCARETTPEAPAHPCLTGVMTEQPTVSIKQTSAWPIPGPAMLLCSKLSLKSSPHLCLSPHSRMQSMHDSVECHIAGRRMA